VNAKLRVTLLAAAALSTSVVSAQRLYRWVDENGNVHFGDRIPPEYADRDRSVLNSQGIAIDREEGAITDEELEAIERQRAVEAAERDARAETARRDDLEPGRRDDAEAAGNADLEEGAAVLLEESCRPVAQAHASPP